MSIELTTDERTALKDALRRGTTGYAELERIVERAGGDIRDIADRGPLPDVISEIVRFFESRDSVGDLVRAARWVNAKNIALLKIAIALGVEPGDLGAGRADAPDGLDAFHRVDRQLERMVDRERGISDLGTFAARVQEWLAQVCRIELGGQSGTGFLIGRSTVLTNHHVVAGLLDGSVAPGDVKVRFDHYRLRDGVGMNGGVVHGLAPEWRVAARSHSPVDLREYDPASLPDEKALDYAILNLDGAVGQETAAWTGRPRGWLVPRRSPWDFADGSFLLVVQHPCRDPISYDGRTDAVVRVNGNGTRVHYRINTLPGSSGSPVFNRDFELVALHHAGQPGSPDLFLPCEMQVSLADYNEGIPISRIVADAEAQGAGWAFGGAAEPEAPAQPVPAANEPNASHESLESVYVEANPHSPRDQEQNLQYARVANYEASPNRFKLAAPSSFLAQADAGRASAAVRQSNASSGSESTRTRLRSREEPDGGQDRQSVADEARKAAQLDVQRSTVRALRELADLMDRALTRFAVADEPHRSSVQPDLSPKLYVNAVNSLAQQIDDAQWTSPVDQDAILELLDMVVAHVLVGIDAAVRKGDYGVVAELSERAADAYTTVGEALGGELGDVLIRVAPYWQMKSAYAEHQRKERKQRERVGRENADPSRRRTG